MTDLTNQILLDLEPYAHANGTIPPSDARELAEKIAEKVGKIRVEHEILIYWLLKAYHTLGRSGWEEGDSDDKTRENLLHVLANEGFEPRSLQAKELLKRRSLRVR